MNPVLLKSLIGVGALGATAATSIGGYYLLKESDPKIIGEKIKDKTPLKPYDASNTEIKKAWETKKNSYTTGQANVDESVLSATNVTEQKIFNECQKILKTPLNTENTELNKKETWAKNWCFE